MAGHVCRRCSGRGGDGCNGKGDLEGGKIMNAPFSFLSFLFLQSVFGQYVIFNSCYKWTKSLYSLRSQVFLHGLSLFLLMSEHTDVGNVRAGCVRARGIVTQSLHSLSLDILRYLYMCE